MSLPIPQLDVNQKNQAQVTFNSREFISVKALGAVKSVGLSGSSGRPAG